MSNHDDNSMEGMDDGHFDELEAVRRFPSEDTWLDLPMPDLQEPTGEDHGSRAFADRVMQAREDDLELDAKIAELDKALPDDVLQQFGAPEPSASFVDKTVQKATEERRQRWQTMLSRYVAPEPSTEFVSRTIAALQGGNENTSKRANSPAQLQAPPSDAHPNAPHPNDPRPNDWARAGRRGQSWTVFGLVAAAAAALLWVSLSGDIRQPLELRLADQASPAVAYANSTSPMSAILARVADDEEPFAMFDEPADGLWLVSDADSEELR